MPLQVLQRLSMRLFMNKIHDFFIRFSWITSMGNIYLYQPPPLPWWYLGRGLLLSRNQPLSLVHICPSISQSGVRITLHPQHIHHLPRLQMSPETSQQQQKSIMLKSHGNTFHICWPTVQRNWVWFWYTDHLFKYEYSYHKETIVMRPSYPW